MSAWIARLCHFLPHSIENLSGTYIYRNWMLQTNIRNMSHIRCTIQKKIYTKLCSETQRFCIFISDLFFCLCHVSFKSRIDCSVFLWLCVALFNSWIEQCCTKNESVGERSTEKNWKFWINTYAIVDRKECRPSKKGQRNVKEISKWFDIHIGGIFESKGIGVRSVQ